MRLYLFSAIAVFLCAVASVPVLADDARKVDFDGYNKGAPSPVGAFLAGDAQQQGEGDAKADEGGKPSIRLIQVLETGRHVSRAAVQAGEKPGQAEFMPNDRFYWELTCEGSNPKPWNVSASYIIDPKAGAHAHAPARALPLMDQQGRAMPNPLVARNIPGNRPFTIFITAPVYATNLSVTAQFSGWCSGAQTVNVQVKVTAQGLIELEELFPEPYLHLKTPTPDHPRSYFGTPDTVAKMSKIARDYSTMFPKEAALTVTDMGLPWGGRFYWANPSEGCWTEGVGHQYHRYGRQADIRMWSIPEANRDCFEEIACKYFVEAKLEGAAPSADILPSRHDVPSHSAVSQEDANRYDLVDPHYHLNFHLATDPPVTPADQLKGNKCAVIPAGKSACPIVQSRD